VPVFAVPLRASAGAYARLCQPDELAESRARGCRVITAAMLSNPFMIGGPQRFDTDAMTVGGGALVTKIGAEGFQGTGVFPGRAKGFATSLGITIKISDGDLMVRAACVVALEVLKALRVLDDEQLCSLADYTRRPVKNWNGWTVGEIRPSAELMEALKSTFASRPFHPNRKMPSSKKGSESMPY
jgi:L-asparaginase II